LQGNLKIIGKQFSNFDQVTKSFESYVGAQIKSLNEFIIKQVQHQMSLALSESIIKHVHHQTSPAWNKSCTKQVHCTVRVRETSKGAALLSDSNRQKTSYWQNSYVDR